MFFQSPGVLLKLHFPSALRIINRLEGKTSGGPSSLIVVIDSIPSAFIRMPSLEGSLTMNISTFHPTLEGLRLHARLAEMIIGLPLMNSKSGEENLKIGKRLKLHTSLFESAILHQIYSSTTTMNSRVYKDKPEPKETEKPQAAMIRLQLQLVHSGRSLIRMVE